LQFCGQRRNELEANEHEHRHADEREHSGDAGTDARAAKPAFERHRGRHEESEQSEDHEREPHANSEDDLSSAEYADPEGVGDCEDHDEADTYEPGMATALDHRVQRLEVYECHDAAQDCFG